MQHGSLITLVINVALTAAPGAGKPSPAARAAEPAAGPFLVRDGTNLLLAGKPYRLIAFNKFDLFAQFRARGQARRQAVAAIEAAGRHGFCAIRFAAVGFYPKDMNAWPNEKVYWGAFDELVAAARANRVHLIPTIYWNVHMFCDMAGECLQDLLTDPDSRSRQYLWLYTHQIVTRYKDEPTILFWELTNEMNLLADLAFQSPHGRSHLNAVSRGSSHMRLRRDHFTTDQMIPFLKTWAEFIRRSDKHHLISTGFSAPRPAAQHLRLARGKGDWTHDSEAELETVLRDTHPDPIDLISIHFYATHDNLRFGNTDKQSVAALGVFKRVCDRIGKPMYLGETGDAYPERPTAPFVKKVLDEAVRLDIPLTLVWDWFSFSARFRVTPTATPDVVTMMEQANTRLRSGRR